LVRLGAPLNKLCITYDRAVENGRFRARCPPRAFGCSLSNMSYDDLARRIANPRAIGLTDELAKRLKVKDPDVTRAQLVADVDERAHVGVYMLAAYVVDDTDILGKGEIYWWSIPLLGDADGKVTWNAKVGLPNGAPPTKCGDREWLSSLSFADPPLLALVPPADDVVACLVRLGMYDDDGARADVPKAMTAGLGALAELPLEYPLGRPEAIVDPVRTAIWESLRAKQDDRLVEDDIRLLRNAGSNWPAGMIASMVTSLVRVYWIAKDERRTEHVAPATLVKGQAHTFKFERPVERGSRIALLARGDVDVGRLGSLGLDMPFTNHVVVDPTEAAALSNGLTVTAKTDAEIVAFHTAP
jgi:hypothetical protein